MNDSMTEALEVIHAAIQTNEPALMVLWISQYGSDRFFRDYAYYLEKNCHNKESAYEFFKKAVIVYHAITSA